MKIRYPPESEPQLPRAGIVRKLRNQFIEGLFVSIPIGGTLLILYWVFSTVDNILQPVITAIWGKHIPGIGFAATLVLIYMAGAIADNFLGKRLIHYVESFLSRIPVFWQIYAGIKQVIKSFPASGKTSLMKVVLVEFPRKGMKAIAFVTNEITNDSGEKLLSILIPTAPNPSTGFFQVVKDEEVISTNLSLDEALKMIISAGRLVPEADSKKTLRDR